jgi:hypothetical protein
MEGSFCARRPGREVERAMAKAEEKSRRLGIMRKRIPH